MSEFKWTQITPVVDVWWNGDLEELDNGWFISKDVVYHRADGPFIRIADNVRPIYIWWYNGIYYGTDIMKFLTETVSSDEQKALIILEWM